MNKILAFAFLFVCSATAAFSQDYVKSLKDVQPDGEYENISVKKVYTDSTISCFVIWVKDAVKPHYHKHHTENILVLEGSGEMLVDGISYTISAGDYITIPQGKIHSVKVTSRKPLKVMSMQSPEFLGKDRHFVE